MERKNLRLLYLITVIMISMVGFQTIDKLQEKNGFQDIKLGTNFKPDSNFILHGFNPEGLEYKYIGPKYKTIGNIKIKSLQITTVKGRIYEINVNCDYDPILINVTEEMFGKANGRTLKWDDYESGKAVYCQMTWKSRDVRLMLDYKKYKSDFDNEKSSIPNHIGLHYSCIKIEKEIDLMRQKEHDRKLQSIKKDF